MLKPVAFIFATFALSGLLTQAYPAPTRDGIAMTSTGKTRKWKSLPVRICLSKDLPSNIAPALKFAAQTWNESFPKPLFDVNCTARITSFEAQNSAEHTVFWVRKGFGKTGDPLALARTLTSYDEDSGELLDADILLNAESFDDWSSMKVDLRSVLIHELGHVLGIQHLNVSTESVMNQYPYQAGIVRHRLDEYERASVGKIYFGSKASPDPYIDAYTAGKSAKALELLRKSQSRDADSYFVEGMLTLELKQLDAAAAAFRKALDLDPKNVFARYRLADTFSRLKRGNEATRELQAVLSSNPDFYEAAADLAAIEFDRGNRTEAKRLFERVLKLNPVHYPACFYLYKLTGETKYLTCVERFAPAD